MDRLHRYWPLLLLAVLVLVFLAPVLLPAPGKATGGADIRALFIPWFEFARNAVRAGELPLWDPTQFAGYPFLSNPQVAFFYPPTWLSWILPVRVALSVGLAFHLWLMAVGTWLLMRRYGATQTASLLAALTFTFSGFTGARILAGHAGLLATVAWLPWVLLAAHWSVERQQWRTAVIAGVPWGLAVLAGHSASLILLGLAWGMLGVYLWWQRRDARVLIVFGAGVLTGLALSAVQLLPFLQFLMTSTRATVPDFEFASNYSLPPAHLVTLLIPEYFGEPTRAGYWSVPVFEELTYYKGIIPLLLLPLALRRPRREMIVYLILMVLGLWLALGRYSPLYRLAFRWVPLLGLARAPGRFALLYTFGAAVVAGIALSTWQRSPVPRLAAQLLSATVATGAVAVTAAMAATGALFASQHPSDTSGRLWHQTGGWAWLLVMILAGGVLLWAVLRPKKAGAARLAGGLLLVLVVADLWQLSFKFVRQEGTAATAMWSDAYAIIGDTEERVLPWGLSIFEQNGAGAAGLRSVFGYNALEPAAVMALTGSIPDPRSTAYDVLSAGYVIAESPQDSFTSGDHGLTLFGQQGNAWVYRRPRVLPPVRIVTSIETIPDSGDAIARLHQPDFDPATTAIVAEEPGCVPGGGAPGRAELKEHENDLWEVETDSETAGLLVVAESAYPGWRVTVDGEEAESLTAYTALRAVCVPAGRHVVVWEYRPWIFLAGAVVTMASAVLVVVAWLQLRRQVGPDA